VAIRSNVNQFDMARASGVAAGTWGAHELFHFLNRDSSEQPYNGSPNLMNIDDGANQPSLQGQAYAAVTSPKPGGFSAFSPDQIGALYKRCTDKHPRGGGSGGSNGPGAGGIIGVGGGGGGPKVVCSENIWWVCELM